MEVQNNVSCFSKREIAAALQIWNRAAISLLDIRHNLISAEEALRGYRLPASAFLYTSGGKAEVVLNDTAYNVERFGMFHGAKGTDLSIVPKSGWLEYYTVLYKATEPPFRKGEYARLLEQASPFRQQYGFAPSNPVFFSEELRKLYEKWKGPTPLNVFYGKAAFYRFVYEIYEELEQGYIHVFEPDVIAMAQRYLSEHYSEAISIQAMCEVFGISYSHFHRSFRQQTGKSPQEYLIQTRLSAAQELLINRDTTIREVAGYCGFQDERNFQRLFLKHTGLSPNAYRENTPLPVRGETVCNLIPFPYNEESQVRLGELKGKGATFMLKQMRSKAVVAAALSLMLALSACAAAPENNNSGIGSSQASAVSSQVVETEKAEAAEEGTRTVRTVMGDVEVPVNPKNVLINFYTGDVLAFGITPVAIDKDSKLSYTPYADLAQDIPQVSFWNSPEELMDWEPDVIILSGAGGDGYYEKVSKIAPVIVCPNNLSERIRLLGEVFGMEEKAEQLLQEYELKVAATKEKIKHLGFGDKTFSIVEATEDSGATVRLYYDDNGRGGEIIYTDLGLNAPKKLVEEYPGSHMPVSMEVVSDYIGDYIFYNRTPDDFDYSTIEIWNSLAAVKNGNIIEFERDLFYHHDIISTKNQLEAIQEALLHLAEQP